MSRQSLDPGSASRGPHAGAKLAPAAQRSHAASVKFVDAWEENLNGPRAGAEDASFHGTTH